MLKSAMLWPAQLLSARASFEGLFVDRDQDRLPVLAGDPLRRKRSNSSTASVCVALPLAFTHMAARVCSAPESEVERLLLIWLLSPVLLLLLLLLVQDRCLGPEPVCFCRISLRFLNATFRRFGGEPLPELSLLPALRVALLLCSFCSPRLSFFFMCFRRFGGESLRHLFVLPAWFAFCSFSCSPFLSFFLICFRRWGGESLPELSVLPALSAAFVFCSFFCSLCPPFFTVFFL
mmetsp:Transcript_9329/g.21377  ORF Transcript_9329/g.21377 Transcript_9329/m.21377 type:complete len:234 (+) Transcript_9329:435-1136(+)